LCITTAIIIMFNKLSAKIGVRHSPEQVTHSAELSLQRNAHHRFEERALFCFFFLFFCFFFLDLFVLILQRDVLPSKLGMSAFSFDRRSLSFDSPRSDAGGDGSFHADSNGTGPASSSDLWGSSSKGSPSVPGDDSEDGVGAEILAGFGNPALLTFEDAEEQFLEEFEDYFEHLHIDNVRKDQYPKLDLQRIVYLDYANSALFSKFQVEVTICALWLGILRK
jgi:hypothetical protein